MKEQTDWAGIIKPALRDEHGRVWRSWADIVRPASQCKHKNQREKVDPFIRDMLADDDTAFWVRRIIRYTRYAPGRDQGKCWLWNTDEDNFSAKQRATKQRVLQRLKRYGVLTSIKTHTGASRRGQESGTRAGTLVHVNRHGPLRLTGNVGDAGNYVRVAREWPADLEDVSLWRALLSIAMQVQENGSVPGKLVCFCPINDRTWCPGTSKRNAQRVLDHGCLSGDLSKMTAGRGMPIYYRVNALANGAVLFGRGESELTMRRIRTYNEANPNLRRGESELREVVAYQEVKFDFKDEVVNENAKKRSTETPKSGQRKPGKAVNLVRQNIERQDRERQDRERQKENYQGAPPAPRATTPDNSSSFLEELSEEDRENTVTSGIVSRDPVKHVQAMLLRGGPGLKPGESVQSPFMSFTPEVTHCFLEMARAAIFDADDPDKFDTSQAAEERASTFLHNWAHFFNCGRGKRENYTSVFRQLMEVNQQTNQALFPAKCLRHPTALIYWLLQRPAIQMPSIDPEILAGGTCTDGLTTTAEPLAWFFRMATACMAHIDTDSEDFKECQWVYFNPTRPVDESSYAYYFSPAQVMYDTIRHCLLQFECFGHAPLTEDQVSVLLQELQEPGSQSHCLEGVLRDGVDKATAYRNSEAAMEALRKLNASYAARMAEIDYDPSKATREIMGDLFVLKARGDEALPFCADRIVKDGKQEELRIQMDMFLPGIVERANAYLQEKANSDWVDESMATMNAVERYKCENRYNQLPTELMWIAPAYKVLAGDMTIEQALRPSGYVFPIKGSHPEIQRAMLASAMKCPKCRKLLARRKGDEALHQIDEFIAQAKQTLKEKTHEREPAAA